mgnify:CR=1 FL=1
MEYLKKTPLYLKEEIKKQKKAEEERAEVERERDF